GPLQGDAFLTDQPGIVCHVRTADCVPLLLADCKNHVIGAVHAGWRGTAQKVVVAAIEKMREKWKTEPADLKAALGPAIGGHCYEVGADVAGAFEKAGLHPGEWMEEIWNDRWYLDLAFANFHLLQAAGVPKEKIYVSLACTACDLEKFASYRKEGKGTGRQESFIMIR
ncbi:MAG: peptidoglycan editing factor PgeF, partial [Deltaproteobacteria bacterium]|nr:peptidoglycan editing factor PgeF [Deltaproteobacteria bacterium]